jgi:hypothetical protein
VLADGRVVDFRVTKDLVAAGLTVDQLVALAEDPTPRDARAIVKREPGKARAVLVTDMSMYLKMAWISDSLEPQLKKTSVGNSLFLDGRGFISMADSIGVDAANPRLWKLPVDQSKFDHHISLSMIGDVLDVISSLYTDEPTQKILESIRTALVRSPGCVVVGDERIPITHGILSGWRWTALLDTWINFGQIVGSMRWLREAGVIRHVTLSGLYVQGDDARLVFDSPGKGIALCEVLQKCGFEVNPSKTWLSPKRDEYLRLVGEDGLVQGYLNRNITAVLWRNPIKSLPLDPIQTITSVAMRYEGLLKRGASQRAIRSLAAGEVRRLASKRQLNPEYIIEWLAAPTGLGGLGFSAVLQSATRRLKSVITYYQYVAAPRSADIQGVPGLMEMAGRVTSATGVTFPQSLLESHLRQTLQTFDPLGLVKPGVEGRIVDKQFDLPIPVYLWPTRVQGPIPPVARLKSGDYPQWAISLIAAQAIVDKEYSVVDDLIDPGSARFSPVVRSVHGVKTWADWVLGTFSLPVRVWDSWSRIAVGTLWRARAYAYLACAINRLSRPFRGKYRDGVSWGFWGSQKSPHGAYRCTLAM